MLHHVLVARTSAPLFALCMGVTLAAMYLYMRVRRAGGVRLFIFDIVIWFHALKHYFVRKIILHVLLHSDPEAWQYRGGPGRGRPRHVFRIGAESFGALKTEIIHAADSAARRSFAPASVIRRARVAVLYFYLTSDTFHRCDLDAALRMLDVAPNSLTFKVKLQNTNPSVRDLIGEITFREGRDNATIVVAGAERIHNITAGDLSLETLLTVKAARVSRIAEAERTLGL